MYRGQITNRKGQKGFSLIEISVVMVIAGLILAGFLMAYSVHLERQRLIGSKTSVEEAVKAIAAFQAKYGYYPCPASREDSLAVATDCSAGAAAGTVSVDPGGGRPRIRIGVMPLSAEVPSTDGSGTEAVQVAASSHITDAYKKRLAYAVVERMAIDRPTYSATPDGSIRVVRPEGGPDITESARYIVFSHGADGRGAYTLDGVLHETCNVNALDGENCNDDAVFSGYMDAPRSFTRDDNNYDDLIGEAINPSPAGTLNAMMGVTAGAVWASAGFSSLGEYRRGYQVILDPDYLAALDTARASAAPIVYDNAAVKANYCRHIFGDIRCDLRLKSSSIRHVGGGGVPQHMIGDHHGVSPEILISCGSGGIVVVSTSGRAVRGDITFDAYGSAQHALGVPPVPARETGPTYQYFTDADYDSDDTQVGNAIYGCAEGLENAQSSVVIPLIMYVGESSGDCGIC